MTSRRDLLAGAIDAARSALADLETDEVPAKLRRVAASSSRRLPAPLADTLLRQLEDHEWLRLAAADLAGDDEAARLFLLRPDGWEASLAELEGAAGERNLTDRVRALEKALAAAERERDVARERAGRALSDAEEARRQAADHAASVRSRVAAAQKESADELREVRAALRRAEETIGRLERDLERAADRVAALRAAKPAKTSTSPQTTKPPTGGWKDVVEMGRAIDTFLAAARPDPVAAKPGPVAAEPFRLPVGVAPDSPDALRWLAQVRGSVTLVVDGYNAAFHVHGDDFSTAEAREALVGRLARYKRSASANLKVIVVFDSAPGQLGPAGPGAVEVRWEHDADESVRQLARSTEGRVAVMSSDREVQAGADRAGAVVIWSEALVTWRP